MSGKPTGLARGLLPILLLIGCSAGHPATSEARGASPPAPQETRLDPCAVAEPLTLGNLTGRYEVTSVKRYRGGLTSEAKAEARVGEVMELAPSEFGFRGERVLVPTYELVCHGNVLIEGEVPDYAARLRGPFWGLGMEREVIWELAVRDGKGKHLARFEVVPGNGAPEIWHLYDGWLFVFRQVGEQTAR